MSSLCDLGLLFNSKGFLGGSVVKNPPAMAGDMGWEDLLQKEMAAHSSILAWEIPCTEDPGRLLSMGCKRIRHNLSDSTTCNPNTAFKTHLFQVSFPIFPALLSCCTLLTFTPCLNSCFSAARSHFTLFFFMEGHFGLNIAVYTCQSQTHPTF